MNNYKIIEQISNDEYLLELNNKYIISYYISQDYIHIENIDYLYNISGGDERIIEKGYDIFKVIEREVVEEIKSL